MDINNIEDFSAEMGATWQKYGKKFDLNADQIEKFFKLTKRLLEENEKYNLTAIRTVSGVIENHIFDSLTVADRIPEGASVLDIGSGAGFPSMPIAIMRPDLNITALDSTEKKTEYIKETAKVLDLSGISTICGRAEELTAVSIDDTKRAKPQKRKITDTEAQKPVRPALRESYDVVIARSVASYNVLSELCVPFLKVGGTFIAMKGEKALHEAKEGENALYLLGCVQKCKIDKPYTINSETDKLFFITTKRSKTPDKYPRKYAQIKKKPL